MNLDSGWDIVVTAKPRSSESTFEELDRAIRKSIARAGIDLADSQVVV
jgi:RNase P protein component